MVFMENSTVPMEFEPGTQPFSINPDDVQDKIVSMDGGTEIESMPSCSKAEEFNTASKEFYSRKHNDDLVYGELIVLG